MEKTNLNFLHLEYLLHVLWDVSYFVLRMWCFCYMCLNRLIPRGDGEVVEFKDALNEKNSLNI